jgi:protein-S-isoprenylcysteine O-methyltransferase Ste14
MKSPSAIEQFKSVLALPFVVLVIIPALIIHLLPESIIISITGINKSVLNIFGIVMVFAGALLFVQSIILVAIIGKGTLAPWNPAGRLVVTGLYKHMRNPMILGVVILLLAESFLFKSAFILIWSIIFFIGNHIYFKIKEEPDLLKRFGDEYKEYMQNVPRWIPRLKGWDPESDRN